MKLNASGRKSLHVQQPMQEWQMIVALLLTIALAPLSCIAGEQPSAFKNMKVIELRNGPNEIDIDGDGVKDVIFIAWRENYNAHGFDMFTFYRRDKESTRAEGKWSLVPFFNDKGVPDKTSYSTVMGADCVLSDIRVVRPASSKMAPVTIVIGVRDFGNSYADEAPVKFLLYTLKRNKEGIAGEPPNYFQHAKVIVGQKNYCDINEAFEKELGLGWYRGDREKEW